VTIRILVVDDHPVVRTGLIGMLAEADDFVVVGEAENGLRGLLQVRETAPNVVLLDLRMPHMDGVGLLDALRDTPMPPRVIVLTTFDTDADILRAIEAGATGYLLKDTPKDDLFAAIRAAARGESWLAPAVASRLMQRMRAPASDALSAREVEVLRLAARGKANKEIARELSISEATVKSHLIHVYRKLGVDDRTSAVTAALERGIITLGGP
jgi:DNA-binding NarL/FixJ family response regulator